MTGFVCKMCGRCCHQAIPVTVYDIQRIAKATHRKVKSVFRQCVSQDTNAARTTFIMRRDRRGACVFLDEANRCRIHGFKPRICTFFPCPDIASVDRENWRQIYTHSAPYSVYWEQAMAENHTREYIARYGTAWNEAGFEEAVAATRRCIVTRPGQQLRVARAESGVPMAMVYDCSSCARHNAETLITLDDVARIARHLDVELGKAFESMVDSRPNELDSGLRMRKPGGRCVFRNDVCDCVVKECRPRHCRFNPCQKRVVNRGMYDRFFLAAGESEEQYRHQVAMAMTRRYVAACGTRFDAERFDQLWQEGNRIVDSGAGKEEFLAMIEPYRYDVQPIEPVQIRTRGGP